MSKIEKERKNDTADISDKGNLQKNKNRMLRANVCKNRAKSKFHGHSQKIIFAHILSIDRHK